MRPAEANNFCMVSCSLAGSYNPGLKARDKVLGSAQPDPQKVASPRAEGLQG
jgi:hypothetical protein